MCILTGDVVIMRMVTVCISTGGPVIVKAVLCIPTGGHLPVVEILYLDKVKR